MPHARVPVSPGASPFMAYNLCVSRNDGRRHEPDNPHRSHHGRLSRDTPNFISASARERLLHASNAQRGLPRCDSYLASFAGWLSTPLCWVTEEGRQNHYRARRRSYEPASCNTVAFGFFSGSGIGRQGARGSGLVSTLLPWWPQSLDAGGVKPAPTTRRSRRARLPDSHRYRAPLDVSCSQSCSWMVTSVVW